MARRPRLLYLVSEDWYFVSHRMPLAIAAKAAGFEVSVATRVIHHGDRIRNAGLNLIPINFQRSGLEPFRELRSIAELRSIYRRVAPDLVHNVALKPVLYGTFAARSATAPGIVNALMGLGWVFSSDRAKARALLPLVKRALRRALSGPHTRVIVQNSDDAKLLVDQNLARPEFIRLIRGSGVDPNNYTNEQPPPGTPLVVLPARLIADKGVREFVAAAAMLKSQGIGARFALVGAPDLENPSSLTHQEIKRYVEEGHVEYWGWQADMPGVLRAASIVCLPTYYGEGLPKCLLEAAASARAMVATDVPGCRELVRQSENGWLVPPRNVPLLAAALREAISQPELCAKYGASGKALVEREFSIDRVAVQTVAVYRELCGGQTTKPNVDQD